MSNKAFKTLIFLLCTIILNVPAKEYSLLDLQVLSTEKNFNEFFKHATDIRPSKRSKNWKSMVEQMGQEFLNYHLSKKQVDPEAFKMAKTLSKWPIFRNNEFFINKRDLLFTREIDQCNFVTNNKSCLKQLEKTYYDFSHSPLFEIELAKALYNKPVDIQIKWNYLKNIVSNEISEFYCHKSPLNELVRDVLYNSEINPKLNEFHMACLKKLKPLFNKKLFSENTKHANLAYRALLKSKSLSKKNKSLFILKNYLTSKYLPQKDIDTSLNLLKKLSKNFLLREQVNKEYLNLDPLPGKIFELKHKNTISRTKILSRYFPELIDSYALKCLDYLSGKVRFANGNPTPECHDLFKAAKKHDLLPESFVKRYKKATYFIQ